MKLSIDVLTAYILSASRFANVNCNLQRDRETETERDKGRHRETQRQADRDRQACRQAMRQAGRRKQAGRQASRPHSRLKHIYSGLSPQTGLEKTNVVFACLITPVSTINFNGQVRPSIKQIRPFRH